MFLNHSVCKGTDLFFVFLYWKWKWSQIPGLRGWTVWQVIWLKEINPQQRISEPTWKPTWKLTWCQFLLLEPPAQNPQSSAFHLSANFTRISFIHWRSGQSRIPLEVHWPCRRPQPNIFHFFFRRTPWNREKWWAILLEDWWSEAQFPRKSWSSASTGDTFYLERLNLAWKGNLTCLASICIVFLLLNVSENELGGYEKCLFIPESYRQLLAFLHHFLRKWIIKHKTSERRAYNWLVFIYCRIIH